MDRKMKNICLRGVAILLMSILPSYATSTTDSGGEGWQTTVVSTGGEPYFTMEYDGQGRLTCMADEYDGDKYTINYTPMRICQYSNYDTGWELRFVWTTETDVHGRVVKMQHSDEYGTSTRTFEYNAEGYLKRSIEQWQSDDEVYDLYEQQYTWSEGNLVEIDTHSVWQYDGGEGEDRGKTTIAYGDGQYDGRTPTVSYLCVFDEMLPFSGLFGGSSRNLPVAVRYEDGDDTEIAAFSYTFNADGTIATETFEWDTDDNVWSDIVCYAYGQEADGVKASVAGRGRLSVWPRVVERDCAVAVTLGHDAASEVWVMDTAGRVEKRIPVPKGQVQVTFGSYGLARGINIVRHGRQSCKIVVK